MGVSETFLKAVLCAWTVLYSLEVLTCTSIRSGGLHVSVCLCVGGSLQERQIPERRRKINGDV